MTALTVDNESRRNLDALLAECAPQIVGRRYTLPEMLGDYQAVPNKPGWYVLPLCIEVEIRAMEFLGQLPAAETASARIQWLLNLSSCLLYRPELPDDPDAAADKVRAFLRGEAEILRPAAVKEISRAFRSEELIEHVLRPLGMWQDEEAEGEEKNE